MFKLAMLVNDVATPLPPSDTEFSRGEAGKFELHMPSSHVSSTILLLNP